MVLGIMNFYNEYLRIMDTYEDKRLEGFPFLNSIFPMLGILALYFWFIKWKGPQMMRNRPPYSLKNTMIVYNVFQVTLCSGAIIYVLPHFRWNLLCAPYDFQDHSSLIKGSYIYFLLKIVDLLDTVFFILRKKDNQVTVLHVFHHSTMVYCTWVILKFFTSGHTLYIGLINCTVHVIMYSYYLIAIFNDATKKSLWWKKYITQLQLFQFALIFLIFTPMQFIPSCSYPKGLALFVSLQNGIITLLFGNFYYQNYIKKKSVKKSEGDILKQDAHVKHKTRNTH